LKLAPLREPGQSLRNTAIDLVFGRLLPSLWLMSVAWVLALQAWVARAFGWNLSPEAYMFVALGLSATCALQFRLISSRVERLQLGRDGEKLVGEFLEQRLIPHGARILHDVPADGFNLDHVVVAPQGVFVIETKTRTKPLYRDARVTFGEDGLLVAGHKPERDPIVQAHACSRWLSELLADSTGQSTEVRAAVVFPGWFIEPMSRAWLNAGHPWVLEPKSLPAFLLREPVVLSEREVAMFANHLTRYVRARQEVERSQS
jgi:hypothetical protein